MDYMHLKKTHKTIKSPERTSSKTLDIGCGNDLFEIYTRNIIHKRNSG